MTMTTELVELAACPGCGGRNTRVIGGPGTAGGPQYWAGCDYCRWRTWGDTEAEAITAWNTRALASRDAVPAGFVMVRKEAIDWLNGESDFECPPDRYFRGEPPRYWWRSVFREKAGIAAAPEPGEAGS